ncbi:MAG: hypothetical protein A3E78_12225 [Alphaproteobacteria bacterium RIFCSPHIGHO2_12_FULL_63_12]|nr:MAG: hypothetical protein A3E78_12225 [Alphaproteobacteria bacterium RIFCSPHIGHO2_12_FULL_63_12]
MEYAIKTFDAKRREWRTVAVMASKALASAYRATFAPGAARIVPFGDLGAGTFVSNGWPDLPRS